MIFSELDMLLHLLFWLQSHEEPFVPGLNDSALAATYIGQQRQLNLERHVRQNGRPK